MMMVVVRVVMRILVVRWVMMVVVRVVMRILVVRWVMMVVVRVVMRILVVRWMMMVVIYDDNNGGYCYSGDGSHDDQVTVTMVMVV